MASGGPCKRSVGIMASLAEIFFERRSLLARIVSRIVGPADVEDILQETFIQSCSAALEKRILNPQAYMLVTARNLALNYARRKDQKFKCSLEELFDQEIDRLSQSAEERYHSDEQFRIFCRAVSRLPPACRRVFIYKKVYGLSQKEIAARLLISESMVEKHIERAMHSTLRFVVDSGHFPELAGDRRSRSSKEGRRK